MEPSKQSVRPLANQFGNTNTSAELCSRLQISSVWLVRQL